MPPCTHLTSPHLTSPHLTSSVLQLQRLPSLSATGAAVLAQCSPKKASTYLSNSMLEQLLVLLTQIRDALVVYQTRGFWVRLFKVGKYSDSFAELDAELTFWVSGVNLEVSIRTLEASIQANNVNLDNQQRLEKLTKLIEQMQAEAKQRDLEQRRRFVQDTGMLVLVLVLLLVVVV